MFLFKYELEENTCKSMLSVPVVIKWLNYYLIETAYKFCYLSILIMIFKHLSQRNSEGTVILLINTPTPAPIAAPTVPADTPPVNPPITPPTTPPITVLIPGTTEPITAHVVAPPTTPVAPPTPPPIATPIKMHSIYTNYDIQVYMTHN